MALEDKEAELGLLLTRMLNEPHDRREIYELIRRKLDELKAHGMPLPEDLRYDGGGQVWLGTMRR